MHNKEILNKYVSIHLIQEILNNILKIGSITELEKLSIHGLLIEPVVESWLNR